MRERRWFNVGRSEQPLLGHWVKECPQPDDIDNADEDIKSNCDNDDDDDDDDDNDDEDDDEDDNDDDDADVVICRNKNWSRKLLSLWEIRTRRYTLLCSVS